MLSAERGEVFPESGAASHQAAGVTHVSACRIEVVAVATVLTAADRCDRCGARAVHRYLFAAGELLLCAHHQAEHRDRLPQPLAASSGQAGE
jgi:hypothetical protein